MDVVKNEKIINTKFVKKLTNSEFYELLIETDNTCWVIVFAINDKNIILATKIVLLNGFVKKSNNYVKELRQVRTIKEDFIENEYKQQQI